MPISNELLTGQEFSPPPTATPNEGAPSPSAERYLPMALGAFGATAGLFAIFALGGFRDAAREVFPLLPILTTGAVGAGAGRLLARWQAESPRGPLSTETVVVRVGAVTALASALSGGLIGLFTWGVDGVAKFALGGAIVGALFYPGCHRIFQSARSATRARHGSLVAALDRRNVLATVLAGIAACSITQVPALLRAQFSSRAPSSVQAALSVVLSMCVLVIFHRLRKQNADDWQKLTALGYHGQWETVAEPLATAENSLDLGLGEEHLAARTARGYRDLGGQASLRGSIEEATAAFVAGDAYHHRAMLVAVASLTASLATCFFAWRSA